MSLFQFTARRLVSQVHCGFKASSKKQKFCLEMARPSSSKSSICFLYYPGEIFKLDSRFRFFLSAAKICLLWIAPKNFVELQLVWLRGDLFVVFIICANKCMLINCISFS